MKKAAFLVTKNSKLPVSQYNFAHALMCSPIDSVTFNPLSTKPTKWSNTFKQFVGKLPTN